MIRAFSQIFEKSQVENFRSKSYFAEKQVPAWDTRRGEEFSEKGPNFLNYVQYFQTMSNTFFRWVRSHPRYGPARKPATWMLRKMWSSMNSSHADEILAKKQALNRFDRKRRFVSRIDEWIRTSAIYMVDPNTLIFLYNSSYLFPEKKKVAFRKQFDLRHSDRECQHCYSDCICWRDVH